MATEENNNTAPTDPVLGQEWVNADHEVRVWTEVDGVAQWVEDADKSAAALEAATAPAGEQATESTIAGSTLPALDTKSAEDAATATIAPDSVPEAGATQAPKSEAAAAAVKPIDPPAAPVVETPAQVAAPAPVVAPAPAPVAAPAPSPLAPVSTTKVIVADEHATGLNKEIIDAVSAKVGNTAKFNLQTLGDYMENMKPRKVMAAVDGARHQVALYRALTNIINNLEDDFAPTFTAVLQLFEQHREGVFHESHVFRFFDHVALPEADRKAFQRLLNLLKLLAPVKGRQVAMGQVDFDRSLEHGITEAGKQRVAAYFNR